MSWLDEEGLDYSYDFESLDGDLQNKTVWVDSDYVAERIETMETKHIMNCIRGIKKGKPYFGQSWKLPHLESEMERRKGTMT
jgi:hypothetical protein